MCVLLTEQDIYHFREGTHFQAYDRLGAHPVADADPKRGTRFAVWAPDASAVSVIGEFNHWQRGRNRLAARGDSSGIWEGVVEGVGAGALYKYHIVSRHGGHAVDKSDQYAFRTEPPPRTASVVGDRAYEWQNAQWMQQRASAKIRTKSRIGA